MPTHAAFVDSIAFQTILDGPSIIARRTLAHQLSNHRLLHATVALKSFVTVQLALLASHAAHPWPADRNFAPPKDHITSLGAMPVIALLTVATNSGGDLGLDHLLDDQQSKLGAVTLNIVAKASDQFLQRQGISNSDSSLLCHRFCARINLGL